MATNNRESKFESVKEFFTQSPEDHDYEKDGGDARVPAGLRKGNPHAEANAYAREHGEALPYPHLEEQDSNHTPPTG